MKTLDELLSELRQRDVQLWLEGERLRYRAAKDSLTPELLAELKTQKAEIIDFLRQITTVASSPIPPIVACERNGNLSLSFGQQRLWFLHQFEPDSSSNNMPIVVRFKGNLNVAVLEESLKEVVRRHELLRTTFPAVNGNPTQVIAIDVSLTLPIIDLQQVPDEQREAEAHLLATKEAHQPFDLANGPILRVMLLRLSEQEHLLVWNMHSIVCDGASADLFYQDLTTIYKAFSLGKASPLPPLKVQYADFAHWQHQWLQGEFLESQAKYWKRKLEGNLPIIELPYDHPRPHGVQTYKGDRAALLLPKALNHALTDLSQKWGVTLFMTLLTVFELLLYRYSGQEDLLISFASAGRGQVETEGLIGFFSNTLVLRSNLAGNPTFRQLLDRVRQDCLEAYTHQDLPFEKLIEELKPEQRSRNSSPLFQVKFSLNPPWSNGRGMASVELPDLTITALFGYIYHGKTKYDLTLVLREQDNGLGMVFDYNAEMFDAITIEQMLGNFKTLLEGIVANPDQPISELPLLTVPEQQKIRGFCIELAELETTLTQYPGVENTVVIAREEKPGDKRLVAYLVLKQGENRETFVSDKLLSFLQQKLPEHLLPSVFVILDSLPLNTNGQVDRQALAALNPTNSKIEKTFATPEDPLQLQLTEIWENVLGIHPIGIQDNFFDIGGNSLLAVRLFSQIEKIFGLNLPLAIILQCSTIEQLANIIRQQGFLPESHNKHKNSIIKVESSTSINSGKSIPWSSLVPFQPNGSKPPLFCIHAIGLSVLYYRDLALHLGEDQPFYALQARGLDGKQAPFTKLAEMADHYIKEIQTIQPEGPYFLGGSSFGGLVAWEIAQQLVKQGQKVAFLALFDTTGPNYVKQAPLQKRVSHHWDNLGKLGTNYVLEQIRNKGYWLKYKLQENFQKLAFKLSLKIWRTVPYNYRKLAIEEANKQAARDYVLQVYPGRVTVFRAEERFALEKREVDSKMGWSEMVLGRLDIQNVPGNHDSIFREPHVRTLSEKMRICIDQAIADT
ncbi:hypothetical protein BV372_14215 [Nostoc sp. T09]|uniref:condensation domain-containing protein n=1 Tax=Nostoc sp. T09 TaxID=1932621 RepID=UPI000A3BF5BF|nr:condensation domain-containing protein [Nostoc sp. T09]OUL34272.1 hypothetical protein BV372_14215 [Nostoc sp. T09]